MVCTWLPRGTKAKMPTAVADSIARPRNTKPSQDSVQVHKAPSPRAGGAPTASRSHPPQQRLKVGNRRPQPVAQRHPRLPVQLVAGQGDVGLALLGVILRQGPWTSSELEPVRSRTASASSIIVNSPGLPRFTGPASASGVRAVHQPHEAVNAIIHLESKAHPLPPTGTEAQIETPYPVTQGREQTVSVVPAGRPVQASEGKLARKTEASVRHSRFTPQSETQSLSRSGAHDFFRASGRRSRSSTSS